VLEGNSDLGREGEVVSKVILIVYLGHDTIF
jgi:hypothetical protein